MSPQYENKIAADRRGRVQVAYPLSLERRKEAGQANVEMAAHDKAGAHGHDSASGKRPS